jgi:uncharacterized membrane protein
MNKILIYSCIVILAALILSLIYYGQTPEIIDSHWDAKGQVNGTMPRFWGLFLLPLVMAATTLLMIFLPKLDPINPNFTGFRDTYYAFILAFNVFMLLVHAYMVFWNANVIRFNAIRLVSVATGLLLYAVALLIKDAKRNWFAGIRTPWTLSSEIVWDKTHSLGSLLFKITGVFTVLTVFVPELAVWVILISSIGASLATFVYSYVIYKQEQRT